MKFFILLALVGVALNSVTLAARTKGLRSSVFNMPANAKVRAEDVEQYLRIQNDNDDDDLEAEIGELRQAVPSDAQAPTEVLKADSSSGRLFLKKFLLLGSLLGKKESSQPIIPIIITGNGNTGTSTGGTTSPSTSTTTGSITGTGTITTGSRAGGIETNDYLIGEEDVVEDQQLNGKTNSNKQQNYFKLKSGKGTQQGIQFMVPPKYMRYFQSNRNAVAVNPAVSNNGANKMQKVRLNNNGNVKRKRSKSPIRRFVQQQ